MYFGYNTNGFAHHRLDDAIAILADLGYEGVAITVDTFAINPFEADWRRQAEGVRGLLERFGLRCVVETGSRFLLDPRRKHQPTLISASEVERGVRLRFLQSCVDIAKILRADAVSFWSGAADDDAPDSIVMRRLVDGCGRLIDYARDQGVKLAFEPEPGMFIDTNEQYGRFRDRVIEDYGVDASDVTFGLTLDINHLQCLEKPPIDEAIGDRFNLLNIHISDGRRGIHDHLMFGEGEIDFPAVMNHLENILYDDGVYVELSRHSHDAVRAAEKSLAFLKSVRANCPGDPS